MKNCIKNKISFSSLAVLFFVSPTLLIKGAYATSFKDQEIKAWQWMVFPERIEFSIKSQTNELGQITSQVGDLFFQDGQVFTQESELKAGKYCMLSVGLFGPAQYRDPERELTHMLIPAKTRLRISHVMPIYGGGQAFVFQFGDPGFDLRCFRSNGEKLPFRLSELKAMMGNLIDVSCQVRSATEVQCESS